jgi:serine/threonine protein kinase
MIKSSEEGHEKESIMSNIPLLLEKRKNGIVEENLGQENKGIEKWKIGKLIGGGASGHVFKAINISNGILAAMKKIHFLEGD